MQHKCQLCRETVPVFLPGSLKEVMSVCSEPINSLSLFFHDNIRGIYHFPCFIIILRACQMSLWAGSATTQFAWLPEAEICKFYLVPFRFLYPSSSPLPVSALSAVGIVASDSLVISWNLLPLSALLPLADLFRPSPFFMATAVFSQVSPGLWLTILYNAFDDLKDLSWIWSACLCLKSVRNSQLPWKGRLHRVWLM